MTDKACVSVVMATGVWATPTIMVLATNWAMRPVATNGARHLKCTKDSTCVMELAITRRHSVLPNPCVIGLGPAPIPYVAAGYERQAPSLNAACAAAGIHYDAPHDYGDDIIALIDDWGITRESVWAACPLAAIHCELEDDANRKHRFGWILAENGIGCLATTRGRLLLWKEKAVIKLNDKDNLFETLTLPSGSEATLDEIQSRIQELAQQSELPVKLDMDETKTGGMFSDKEPVLTVSHPGHQKDYQKYAITLSRQYGTGVAKIYVFGTSKQGKKAALRDVGKSGLKSSWQATDGFTMVNGVPVPTGKGMGNAVKGTASLVGLAMSLGGSKKKLEEEQLYYQILYSVIGAALTA